ncbi:hypothetical protein WA026_021547 [Henosepilachna vigintioctopunctata]|uniref:Dilute class unconventional myosin n=1 Tax=Henosepilachna vigintioctopunctata TaxID=420089 RepID=A0AAW1VAI8_9CUCU
MFYYSADIDTIQAYRGQSMGDLDPHIFAVAEEALTKLERERKDQSIIISGESGAGKTVSAKYTMRYFATIGGNTTETQMEKKILASSPIMEALGNAKTTRNDNSSRFGKFIELQFNKQFHICGASMRTYLLEKSRVVFQSLGERNYHIFYQLCASRTELPELYLDDPKNFSYLNHGSCLYIEGVDDYQKYQEMVEALKMLGFSEEKKYGVFKILAAILHLGNIMFEETIIKMENCEDTEGCSIAKDDKHIELVSNLLEINSEELRKWLCTRKIVSAREMFLKPMSVEEAQSARDALAKHIYAELFNWVTNDLNSGLRSEFPHYKFIGVLDIYGFETFETNSFEQFCINYANEKLQQQFNLHVFKLEQQEYLNEEIEWKIIEFYDNQPCIDLIEVKLGILDLLDEECKMPKGSDGSWTEKMYAKCMKYSHFGKAKFGESAFTIEHFAEKVQYESNGFLEKNRDTVYEEQIDLIKQSKREFVRRIFDPDSHKPPSSGNKVKIVPSKTVQRSQKINRKTVGSQFRDSLNLLMQTINSTTPYYIRCIKPNDNKRKFEYNTKRASQQLRACGVLETIRLSAAGFPSRWTYNEFFNRYRVLCKSVDIKEYNTRKICENILNRFIKDPDMYRFGKTKIFFRASQVAYLEKIRSDKLRQCCIIMQKTVRTFICRKKFLRIKRSVMLLQKRGRGYLGRRLAKEIRRRRAAITIQRRVRGWLARVRYQRIRKSVQLIQTRGRGYLARRKFAEMRYNAKAIIIQKYWRGYLARKTVDKMKHSVIICQAAVRRFLARKLYKRLKIEARSIENVKALNRGLENKIISLQQKIGDLEKNNKNLEKKYNNNDKELKELKQKLPLLKALEIEVKNIKTILLDKNELIRNMEEKLRKECDDKMDLIQEREDILKKRQIEIEERSNLMQEIENLKNVLEMNEKNKESQIKASIEEEKLLILNEQDSDRHAYQKLLQEYHNLEQHCEELKMQMDSRQGSHNRNISDVSSITTLDIPEDHGYGSVKSVSSILTDKEQLDTSNWKAKDSMSEGNLASQTSSTISSDIRSIDIGLVLKLQHKLAEVEKEKLRIQNRLDELDNSPMATEAENALKNTFKITELEMDNSSLKSQLIELQNSINEGSATSQVLEQLRKSQDELERRSDEIIQLKTILASQTSSMKNIVTSKNRIGEYINEDGELALAYETQKTINKQLELELQDEKMKSQMLDQELRLEIAKLKEDNEKLQQILAMNLTEETNSQNESYLKLEVTRLISENLELQDSKDSLSEKLRKKNRQIKYLMNKLKKERIDIDDTVIEAELDSWKTTKPERTVSTIKKQEREYQGIFTFKSGDETIIMRNLVIQLKPRTAITMLPCLPAYIVFMCIRHTDLMNDEEKVKSLISAFTNAVKKVIRKRHEDLETSALWFANTLRLLHIMKQYSGEKTFQQKNTPKQNEKCLRNFDLSEYRQVLSDIAVWINQALVRSFIKTIQPLIVPAILEHEEIQGLSGNMPGGMRRKSSVAGTPSLDQKPTTTLKQAFTNINKKLTFYGVDPEVISQIFRQFFYFLCATSLNNLLLRKDMCHWSKGVQIRHNLSYFEMWIKDNNQQELCYPVLQPIIQAAQLLQARKEEEDVDSICDMCNALSGQQISKILNLYTPVDEFEKRIPKSFVEKVKAELKKRSKPEEPLLMETNFQFPVKFPFKPSDICMENIELPDFLNLDMLEKV